MKIKLLAFGQIAEIIVQEDFQITDGTTSDQIKNILQKQYPSLSTMQYAIAVNKRIIVKSIVLNDGDTIALLPPFSGG